MEGLAIVGLVFGIVIAIVAYNYAKHIKKQ